MAGSVLNSTAVLRLNFSNNTNFCAWLTVNRFEIANFLNLQTVAGNFEIPLKTNDCSKR